MALVQARLYGFAISNPANSARMMLAYKGVETKWIELPPGIHPLILKLLGYGRGTVPACDARMRSELRLIALRGCSQLRTVRQASGEMSS